MVLNAPSFRDFQGHMEGLPNNIQTIWEAHHRCVDVKEKLQETSWVAVLHVSSFKLEFSPINQPEVCQESSNWKSGLVQLSGANFKVVTTQVMVSMKSMTGGQHATQHRILQLQISVRAKKKRRISLEDHKHWQFWG